MDLFSSTPAIEVLFLCPGRSIFASGLPPLPPRGRDTPGSAERLGYPSELRLFNKTTAQ